MASQQRFLESFEKKISQYSNSKSKPRRRSSTSSTPSTPPLMNVDIMQYEFSFTKKDDPYFCGKIKFSSDEEREARFFVVEDKQIAMKIWKESSNLRHNAILKLWFVSYCDKFEGWILGYEKFDHLLDAWLKLPDIATKIRDHDLLNTEFSPSISTLIEGINYLNERNLFHGGLDQSCNFVVIDKEVKIINIGKHSTHMAEIDPKQAAQFIQLTQLRVTDIMGIKSLLNHILNTTPNAWIERDTFLAFFNLARTLSYEMFILLVLGHPFLKTSDEARVKTSFDILHVRDCNEEKRWEFHLALGDPKFGRYYPWNEVAMSDRLKEVYDYDYGDWSSNYQGHSSVSLLIFLRNVYWHPKTSMEAYDAEIRTLYPDFLNRAYEAACRIFAVEVTSLVDLDIEKQHVQNQNVVPGRGRGRGRVGGR
ncbi:hypothetical protein RchiOBHm_Chr1g0379131 [Rosa chinensis]|uniref:Protein kinase domain-containing protein n=1 Tax=Rosa chinensis TaxID=74649 RepID=A0A2P6SNI1_ROSCH|nr:hypothetical protein RchiOBHm_Chr1g0379131 [Rosa chinensis]